MNPKTVTPEQLDFAKDYLSSKKENQALDCDKRTYDIAEFAVGVLKELLFDVKEGGVSVGEWYPHLALRSVYSHDNEKVHAVPNHGGLVADCDFETDMHHICALHNIWCRVHGIGFHHKCGKCGAEVDVGLVEDDTWRVSCPNCGTEVVAWDRHRAICEFDTKSREKGGQ